MIVLLSGENSFEVDRELGKIAEAFKGEPEKIDGSELEIAGLPDLLAGQSLFATKRLVIIKNLSENKPVWDNLPQWLERLSDDTQLVLVESKPDKRTKTYKDLQKTASLKECTPWTDRDRNVAETWAMAEAKSMGLTLARPLASHLIWRTGVDQWRIYHALEKLSLLEAVTPEIIDETVEQSPAENVFQLLETALRGNAADLAGMVETLSRSEEPYRVFGLLISQILQLTTLSLADKPAAQVAKDIGAHPYVLSRLAPYAKKLGPVKARVLVEKAADIDTLMKTTSTDTWVLVERLLLEANRLSTS